MSEAYCVLRSPRERGCCTDYKLRSCLRILMRYPRSLDQVGNCGKQNIRNPFLLQNHSLSRRWQYPDCFTFHFCTPTRNWTLFSFLSGMCANHSTIGAIVSEVGFAPTTTRIDLRFTKTLTIGINPWLVLFKLLWLIVYPFFSSSNPFGTLAP